MSRTVLHPPDGVHDFVFHVGGCGKPHQYDGRHGIDCPACVEVVRIMSPDERISHPHLRVPLVATGDTPGEVDTMRRVEEAKRHAASWRLEEAEDPPEPTAEDRAAERERLKARLAELDDDPEPKPKPAPEPTAKAPTAKRAPAKA